MEDILIPLHEIAMTKIEMAKWYVNNMAVKKRVSLQYVYLFVQNKNAMLIKRKKIGLTYIDILVEYIEMKACHSNWPYI